MCSLAIRGGPLRDLPQGLPSDEPTLYSSLFGKLAQSEFQARPRKVERVTPTQVEPTRSSGIRDPLVTVVIVNYASWPDVRRLVGELTATDEVASGTCEVLIVDNDSPERPPPELESPPAGVRLIARADNGGFAVGVNAGWRAARGRWILVLNPDVMVPAGQLAAIVDRAAELEGPAGRNTGLVGFALRNPDGSRQPSVGAFPSLARTVWEQVIPRSRRKYQPVWRIQPGPVDWVTGACVLIRAALLEELGGMDEDFFLYHEEVALCRSARNRGWQVVYDPSVAVSHLHPLQNRPISPKMRVITRHSKLLYFRKHLPRWQFAFLSRVISLEARIRGTCSMIQGRAEDGRAWRTIDDVARAFRAGIEPRGRGVLTLAESISVAADPKSGSTDGNAPRPSIVTAGKRRGASGATLFQPRKDGPSCR
jgi:GT2 family glycosyltransferase